MIRRLHTLALLLLLLVTAAPVAASDGTRLRVAVVLDVSLSMKQYDPDKLATLAARLIADLSDQRDHVTIMTFGTGAKTVVAGSGNSPELQKALDGIGPTDKCTDYAAGFAQAAQAFSTAAPKGERRLVVFLTDGEYQPPNEGSDSCDDKTRFDKTVISEAERKRLGGKVLDAAGALAARKAKVFVVGLGRGFQAAERSRALLSQVAQRTGGRLILADDPNRVPELFTDVFAALVGSPVQKPAAAPAVTLDVPEDAAGMHVIVRTDAAEAPFTLTRSGQSFPFGKPPTEARGPDVRLERGKRPRGYAVTWLARPPAGPMQLARSSGSGPLSVWAIYDVGTALRFEGVGAGVPDGHAVKGAVRLVGRSGSPVRRDPSYLGKVRFRVTLADRTLELPARGKDAQPFDFGSALAARDAPYLLRATAEHDDGFLDVEPVEHSFRVVHRLPAVISIDPVRFDSMAEPGTIGTTRVRLTAPERVPVALGFMLSLSDDTARNDLRFEPAGLTFDERTREAEVRISFADPKALRWDAKRYGGELVVTPAPETAPLLSGESRFSAPIDGTLRSWTLLRWMREHRVALGLGLGVLLLLIWLVGRALAAKFPAKARIHYVEIGSQFPSDSLVKRYAKRGAYRSARSRFPLGKKSKPLVSFVARGQSFEVRPEPSAGLIRLAPEGEDPRRAPFTGRWDERYRLADRFEVWLTRS